MHVRADAKLGKTDAPPQPYDPSKVLGMVKYGRQQGKLDSTATGKTDIVYSYKYDGRCGGNTYQVWLCLGTPAVLVLFTRH